MTKTKHLNQLSLLSHTEAYYKNMSKVCLQNVYVDYSCAKHYLSSFSNLYLSVALVSKLRQTIQFKEPARQREKQNISPTVFPGQLYWRHVHKLHPSVFVSVLYVEDWAINGNQVQLIHKPGKCSPEIYGG